ncbi:chaperone protein dnaJ 11, chloroplastic-like [Andrographis paniculata]|uniref:chaperone protein dnaJ 11, chloroplastic-like n=1 Tax=Andrographis paniculata TaxID=175694 RepID=UPI0021E70469|nr:chaperone protein dnaJ 11, chloroplastic-like [Andrographis paniculata]
MASASFLLSIHTVGRKSSAIPPAPRISAGIATISTGSRNASRNASLYEVLGMRSSATCQDIKSAYRKLARVLHPDVAAYRNGDDGRTSSDEFMRVHAAYVTLSDPEKREVYDDSLFRRRRSEAISLDSCVSGMNGRRRNWETDQCW